LSVALQLRDSHVSLSLTQSVVETLATLLLIVIRMANGYSGYAKIRRICTGPDPHRCKLLRSKRFHYKKTLRFVLST